MFVVELDGESDLGRMYRGRDLPSHWAGATFINQRGDPVSRITPDRYYLALDRTYHPIVLSAIAVWRHLWKMDDCGLELLQLDYEALRVALRSPAFCGLPLPGRRPYNIEWIKLLIEHGEWVDDVLDDANW